MAKLLEITLENHPSHNRNPFGVGPAEESVTQVSRPGPLSLTATLGSEFRNGRRYSSSSGGSTFQAPGQGAKDV
jgi:hypothetical protein